MEQNTRPRAWCLFIEKDGGQRSVCPQLAAVIDEAYLAKSAHKVAGQVGAANRLLKVVVLLSHPFANAPFATMEMRA